ncbi:MAG: alpha/beta hydrolase [Phycisphaerae bacterium]|nr:alpha/beta hydrolase [Tepidisphaeraceae bacterium]
MCAPAVTLVLLLGGCGAAPLMLMPTPNLYADGLMNPFDDVPPELQNNKADVLYVTDRTPAGDSPERRRYGFGRSRSVGFGLAEVRLGNNVSWPDLVKASTARVRLVGLPLIVGRVVETGRFAPTPGSLIEVAGSPGAQASASKERAAEDLFRETLAARLSHTRVKEVYVFVHGYNNTFEDGVTTIAQLWHFFGRQGVPVAYTWPAGSPGALRGYTYDRESSEFTVYHFKQMLRLIASCPDVEKVNLIGHSRGTDVVASGLRELHLELGSQPQQTREALKLGTLVLAAPDMDFDVVLQRMATARIGRVPERSAIYVCNADKALGMASWLFGSLTRLGGIRSTMFSPDEIHTLRAAGKPEVIDAQITDAGAFGHDYFHSSPAVSSDLILLMRYRYLPGAEHGRPLGVNDNGFWVIGNNYPAKPPTTAPSPATARTPEDK